MEQYILPRGLSQGFAAIADVADGASLCLLRLTRFQSMSDSINFNLNDAPSSHEE